MISIFENWRLSKTYKNYFHESLDIPILDNMFKQKLIKKIYNKYYTRETNYKDVMREKIFLKNEVEKLKELKFNFKYGPIIITSIITIMISGITMAVSFGSGMIMKLVDIQGKDNLDSKKIETVKNGLVNIENQLLKLIGNVIFQFLVCILILIFIYSAVEYMVKKLDILKIYFYSVCYDIINELNR
jgi:hypothetical protein